MSEPLFVISGPSGVGKTKLAHEIEAQSAAKKVITCTTREPRKGEVDGKDYRFLSHKEFRRLASLGDFVEHATVHKNLYGTLREDIDCQIDSWDVPMLVMDIQGLETIARIYPTAQTIFLVAPVADLIRRLDERNIADSLREDRIAELRKELSFFRSPFVRRIIDNSDGNFDKAVLKICTIMAMCGNS